MFPLLQLPQTPFCTDILSRSWDAAAPLLPCQGIIWKNSLGSIPSYICYEPAHAHSSPFPGQGGGKYRANQNQALFSHHLFSRSLGEKRKQTWELRFPFMLPWEFPIRWCVHFPRNLVIHSTLMLRPSYGEERWEGNTHRNTSVHRTLVLMQGHCWNTHGKNFTSLLYCSLNY